MKRPKTLYIGLFLCIVFGVSWVFWPDTLAVRGPVLSSLTGQQTAPPKTDTLNATFTLPKGFSIEIYSDAVPGARMMAVAPNGDIFVSATYDGVIYKLTPDGNGDGKADTTAPILKGLNDPHGIAFWQEWLYVAESHQITRYPYNADSGELLVVPELVYGGLPSGGNHYKRTLHFSPDDTLHLTVGSSCNVCLEDDPRYATMMTMAPDGSQPRVIATGLRNTVDFDWHPLTKALYGTDNGRDLIGANIPQDELNLIVEGAFYGWPHAYDNNVFDPTVGDTPAYRRLVETATIMVHGFGAHRAPLGIGFIKGETLPEMYKNSALVALHGSWNSPVLVGYKVVSLHFMEDGTIEERDFLTGFLQGEDDVIGRPVDSVEGDDGSLYISDDYAGVVYRVRYHINQSSL